MKPSFRIMRMTEEKETKAKGIKNTIKAPPKSSSGSVPGGGTTKKRTFVLLLQRVGAQTPRYPGTKPFLERFLRGVRRALPNRNRRGHSAQGVTGNMGVGNSNEWGSIQ